MRTRKREEQRWRKRSSFPLAPVDWLECDSSSVRERAVSLLCGKRRPHARRRHKTTPVYMRRRIKYLDPTWGTYYSTPCTWALESAAKICNHFRLHRCCPLWPHPRVSLAIRNRDFRCCPGRPSYDPSSFFDCECVFNLDWLLHLIENHSAMSTQFIHPILMCIIDFSMRRSKLLKFIPRIHARVKKNHFRD